MFEQLTNAGIAIAGIDVGESYGSPKGCALFTALYEELIQRRGFSAKPCLLARSCGGLMLYNWAVEHPHSVAGIAGIYPVCDLKSYPGLKAACRAYDMTEKQLTDQLPAYNPVSRVESLAKAHVPIFHIHGDSDGLVPLEKNSAALAQQYRQFGGRMELTVIEGQGHDMWSGWFRCQELVDFMITTASGKDPPDPAFEPVTEDPKLPRVLLIGDSISIGYTVPVRNLLRGRANVHRIPENGGPTTNGLAKLERWLGQSKWDVIHFNFGLHDIKILAAGQRQVPPDAYENNLRNFVVQLQATRAKLIWATTTPVPTSVASQGRLTDDVPVYNEIARRIMNENHIIIDDLYGFTLPQLAKIQRPRNVHFTEEGSEALGKVVAASIESALTTKN